MFRREEVGELVDSLKKELEKREGKGEIKDMEIKMEKLQMELTGIDEQIFELEKKYGECRYLNHLSSR
jgi:hypothetical protein